MVYNGTKLKVAERAGGGGEEYQCVPGMVLI